MRLKTNLALIVLVFLVFAGCVGGTAKDSAPPVVGGAGNENGVPVRGVVMSEEIFPVPGAVVTLDNVSTVTTNATGDFEFLGVTPGTTVVLAINATGYEPVVTKADVPENGVDGLRVTLKGIPGQAPYAATYIKVGFDACSVSAVYSAGSTNSYTGGNCPFGKGDTTWKQEVAKEWVAGVHEMDWKSIDDMIFASSVSTTAKKGF